MEGNISQGGGGDRAHHRDIYGLVSDSDGDSSDNPINVEPVDRSVPVTYFTHELSLRGRLRRFFIRNNSTRMLGTFCDLILKSLICVMYIVRVGLDDLEAYECAGSPCYSIKRENGTIDTNRRDGINWYVLLWIKRDLGVWIIEVILAAMSMLKALLMIYITTKGHRISRMLTWNFCFEIICSVPMLCTLVYPLLLKDLFVPVFLNCWLSLRALQRIYNDLHLTKQKFQTISVTMLQQMVILMSSILCLAFVTVCMIQHLQRASPDLKLNMFDSVYFVIVTFTTVGYGDISPDIWLSRLYMIIMICVAFASIPVQIEGLVSTYVERQKAGGEYSSRAAANARHVLVCSSTFNQETLMDFLNEFYAHPKLEEHTVILLCPQELNNSMQVVLKDPKWMRRVIYMKGSPLKDIDLNRSQVQTADACFFLAPRPCAEKVKADRHTILRSWAVKDFAPGCKQYIQMFSAANKIHVKFAEHVVCEDEFKYALLANNCLYPGLSTLVSLLVHTSSGREGMLASEQWQQIYGRHSGNEIYHIQLQKSLFFKQFEGETFPKASAEAHHRFGVALLAVLDPEAPSPCLQLNPGPLYTLKATDFCFYMSVTREEDSEVNPDALRRLPRRQSETIAQIALVLQKYHTGNDLVTGVDDPDESVFDTITSLMGNNITRELHNNQQQQQNKYSYQTTASSSSPTTTPDVPTVTSTTSPESTAGGDATDYATSTPPAATVSSTVGNKKKFTVTPTEVVNKDNSNNNNNNNGDGGNNSLRPLLAQTSSYDCRSNQDLTDVPSGKSQEDLLPFQTSCTSSTDSLDDVDHRHRAGRVLQYCRDMEQDKLTTGSPPVTIYAGAQRTSCHIMTEPRNLCCLEWGTDCEHCTFKNARDKRWGHQLIILSGQYASTGIFNFIVPLRSSFIGIHGLSPIVLLLEEQPSNVFLDTIAQFPLVYYIIGSIRSIDDLLMAGINKASHLVVVNRDADADNGGEEILADSDTIVAVQTIFRLFPNTYVVTELSQASNMRFMQFTAQEASAHKTTKLEQKLREMLGTNMNHFFRQPFVAGQVFSASMLDTLLYQTFVKGYLISFVRLLLGIDAEEGSGHLSSIRIKRATVQKFRNYGELYDGLCTATGEIPFAIYRTERTGTWKENMCQEKFGLESEICQAMKSSSGQTSEGVTKTNSAASKDRVGLFHSEQADLGAIIRNRLKSLDLSQDEYCDTRRRPNTLSYIITNPAAKQKLKIGDIIYVIQPSSMHAKPSKRKYFHMNRSQSFSLMSGRPPAYQTATRRRAQSIIPTGAGNYNTYHTTHDAPHNAAAVAANLTFPSSRGQMPLFLRNFNTDRNVTFMSPMQASRSTVATPPHALIAPASDTATLDCRDKPPVCDTQGAGSIPEAAPDSHKINTSTDGALQTSAASNL